MANFLSQKGINALGFFFLLGPKGKAGIGVQMSAGRDTEHLNCAITVFAKAGKALNIV